MVKRILKCFVLLVLFPSFANAMVFERQGEIFAIEEDDFRSFIYKRLEYLNKTGAFKKFEKETIKRVSQSVNRPKPLSLSASSKSYSYHVSPEIILNQDIRLPSGELVAAKGTRVNPMNKVHYQAALLFFNADDENQVRWIKRHQNDYGQSKLILTSGDIKETSQLLGRVYFDQEGVITQKLNIKHIPAIATQEGNQWLIKVIGEGEFKHD